MMPKGHKHTPEARAKIGASQRGRKWSAEQKETYRKTITARRIAQLGSDIDRQNMPEYRAYYNAMTRCEHKPGCPDFENYAGRGIKFLFTSFEQFYGLLGPRPYGTTLDRINNDGNYEPGNCRWATRHQQLYNRRRYRPGCRNGIICRKPLPRWWKIDRNVYVAEVDTERLCLLSGQAPDTVQVWQ